MTRFEQTNWLKEFLIYAKYKRLMLKGGKKLSTLFNDEYQPKIRKKIVRRRKLK